MKCLRCRLENPPTAEYCDCGYMVSEKRATVRDPAPAEPIRKAEGVLGSSLELYADHIKIVRKGGVLSPFTRGEKVIPLRKLTGVQYREPGTFTNGFIQFVFSGSSESKGGLFDATKDENTVMFNATNKHHFGFIRDQVQKAILEEDKPVPAASAAPASDLLGSIERLVELHTRGMLTAEEFAAAKAKLLQ